MTQADSSAAMRQMIDAVLAMRDGDFSARLPGHWTGLEGVLADALNSMTKQLGVFASEVTRVAREVGTDGKLGGQAEVPEVSGGWRQLTDSVNSMAANVTAQARHVSEVTIAVARGDLSKKITVEARGEILQLKEAINTMVDQLRAFVSEVTRVAREVGTEGKLGGQAQVPDVAGTWKDLTDSVNSMAGNLTAQVRNIAEVTTAVARGDLSRKITVDVQGELLELKSTVNTMVDQLNAFASEVMRVAREVGSEGKLDGQAQVPGIAGTWKDLTDNFNSMIDDLRLITDRNADATLRTEALLAQAQQLTAELQTQQRELQQTNAQLALISRYKSEFLANMSHELRTPLNSILILGQQLSENVTGNLTPKQLELVRTIYGAGADLLSLITDILDLAKIESGTVSVEPAELLFSTLLDSISRQFRHDAERRGLAFEISLDPSLGRSLVTDQKRLQQVLTNLLANAFKFTAIGGVRLAVFQAFSGWTPDHPGLTSAGSALAFEVNDTGIGIAPEKQRLVFEAFQQADAGTSRKYGGTGLGLAISRDLATLLGGELQLRSTPGVGSTFTLLLPLAQSAPARVIEGAELPELPELRARRFDEAALFRPRAGTELFADPRAMPAQLPRSHQELRGRKVLVVDDDVRNIFALGSVLERHGIEVVPAQTGREAVAILESADDISAVLMDIMMPELDGYQTIQLIRQQPARQRLPIIALTAKAMQGDREKCLDAGASDYLAKPVDIDQLLGALRTCLHR